jgi:UDP-glucose 4-epimerase
MRILLLGGFGFIGTNILKHIDKYYPGKYSVMVFDKFQAHPYGVSFNCIDSVYTGDFADSFSVRSIMKTHKFDLIIHSLSSTVPVTSNNARFDIESNLIPTVELLNMMVEYNQKKIIYISSGGAIYGESDPNCKHKESDEAYPRSSYGIVKLAAEKYLFQYALLYKIQPLVLRLSNPYGSFHYSDKQGITNVAISSAFNNKEFDVWGTGDSLKDYIYIEDFCGILFQLLEKQITNKVINIGSGQVLSLKQILAEIKIIYPQFFWKYTTANIFDITHFELDTSELISIIGEYTFTRFRDGLNLTKLWLENNQTG